MQSITLMRRMILALTLVLATEAGALAYPDKPIDMLIGFEAGGGVDLSGRVLADLMSKRLKQPVVPTNRGGGGGSVAVSAVLGAPPDGHTVGMITTATLTSNPYLFDNIAYKASDFRIITTVAHTQPFLVAAPDGPFKSVDEMVNYAKQKGRLTVSVSLPLDKIGVLAVAERQGMKVVAVPSKGSRESLNQILGKHVDASVIGGIATAEIQAGRILGLATLGGSKVPQVPNVPTLTSLGYDIDMDQYFILVARKDVPDAVISILSEAAESAKKEAQLRDLVEKSLNMDYPTLGSGEVAAFVQKQSAAYEKLISHFGKN